MTQTSSPTLPSANAAAEDAPFRYHTLDELREAGLRRLDVGPLGYLEGGSSAERTLRRNRSAFDRWTLVPRVMSGLPTPSTATSFLGIRLEAPILTAPFGSDGLFDADGHMAVARANARAGTAGIVPEAGTHSVEAVREAAPAATPFGQLHPMGDPDNFVRMLKRYEAAGFSALCITCDCPTSGWKNRNLRNEYVLPEDVINGNYPPGSGTELEAVFGQIYSPAEAVWGWDRLSKLMANTSLPWIAKGVLTPEDATAALVAGASALQVSTHGGRQLDSTISAIEALPHIRDAVGPEVPIAFDSGIRDATDIVKAIALGADVVVLGRLAVYGLAAAGEEGVYTTLELLQNELTTVLTLLGRGGVAELDRTAVRRETAA
ncbi:alpha-hydroxy acid oxidase [Streptomyces sp. NPDC004629]|uniref:alpha-hydroxy acid oxidase n=1 Tax=Streptomyces sp. NPDC004629 TaxID=3364705 RepID=UPI0036C8F1CC